ncbi:MAG: pirin family protein [Nocardioidaceae bacterium]
MSNFEADVEIADCGGAASAAEPTVELLHPRPVLLGPRQEVQRVLPNRDRRMIGAWCFVDHYGPEDITGRVGMWVPPHPHTGLQTVSWLMAGEVHHRDSLGSDAMVVPGHLNLMTAGPGIAHSEASPPGHSALMHGLQLWVALPDGARTTAQPDFTQYRDLPHVRRRGLDATVVMGALEDVRSAATTYSPLAGADLSLQGEQSVGLRRDFEYGVLGVEGSVQVEGHQVGRSEICYVGGDRDVLTLSADGGARVFLLGGEPFAEQLVMWWNFIGRSHDEIVEFRRVWNDVSGGGVFGEVLGFDDDRLPAPPMPTTQLKARGRRR